MTTPVLDLGRMDILGEARGIAPPGPPPGPLERRGVRIAGYYAFMLAAGVLGLVKGLTYSKLLGSSGLGYYSLALLVTGYCELLSHLGLYRGLECYLPSLYGGGRREAAEDLRNRIAGTVLLTAAGFALVAVAGCLLYPFPDARTRSALMLAALLTVSTVLFGIAVQDLRSRTRTLLFGLYMCLKNALAIAVGIALARRFGFRGALAAEVAVYAVLAAVVVRLHWLNPRLVFGPLRELRGVFGVGVPLTLRNLANDLCASLDRWAVIAAFGVAAFGQYAFAMLLASVGLMTQMAISTHIGPRAAFAFGRHGDASTLLRTFHRVSLIVLGLAVVAFLPFRYVAATWVPRLFPDYGEGAVLLQIVYWGVVFQILTQYEWVPMALRGTASLLAISIVSGVLTAAVYGLGIRLGWSMAAFAWVFVAGRALAALGQLAAALRATRGAVGAPPAAA